MTSADVVLHMKEMLRAAGVDVLTGFDLCSQNRLRTQRQQTHDVPQRTVAHLSKVLSQLQRLVSVEHQSIWNVDTDVWRCLICVCLCVYRVLRGIEKGKL